MDAKINTAPRATLNPTRRFAVRLSLAAGATVATLLGAQALALRERPAADTAADVIPTTETSSVVNVEPTALPRSTPIPPTPVPAAPQLVVIRHPRTNQQAGGRTVRSANNANNNGGAGSTPKQIVPPQPAVVAPQPVVAAQAPVQQQSAPVVHAAPAQPAPRTSSSKK